jgi:Protein of unknown function (DUF3800)
MPESEFIAYFDESGDHGLESIDRNFPVFVLCACVFHKCDYIEQELCEFSRIKFKHFGHDAVVFHSRDIRKRLGPFQILVDRAKSESFMSDLTKYFREAKLTIIASVINKRKLVARYAWPDNPYAISMLFCLERLYAYLKDHGETGATMYCVFEKRGEKEDQQLAAEFERVCAGANSWGQLPFRMVFASKLTNMPGLQAADLAAYPIARFVMDRSVPNPAFRALKGKFRQSPGGRINGWGCKVFP